ncbi:mitoshell isoform X2 [Haematobia irritans]|uniref:mitoshell isoform X2 n=1 Tax=Haematobia irritans TaxID=7368 RepID=UPI003F4F9916
MDRLRLPIISQDIPSFWPHTTTIVPVPFWQGPNVTYPLIPYAPVPIYPPVSNPSNSMANQYHQDGEIESVTNNQNLQMERNKINMQIQCVSQSIPQNVNPLNVCFANGSCGNLGIFPCPATHHDKDTSSSLRSTPIFNSEDNDVGGDADNSNFHNRADKCASLAYQKTPSLAKFFEITRLALKVSDIVEKVSRTYRNRPCFNKIDHLCARLKQDITRPDGVLANINSQGLAWAVKDMIFVFTRVVNAWLITKGYVYNTPEGLNKVKSALSPDFEKSFSVWQDASITFIENLTKSVINLDNLVQSQRKPECYAAQHSYNIHEFNKNVCEKTNYNYNIVETSKASQAYIKTGTYTPMKKSVIENDKFGTQLTSTTVVCPQSYLDTPLEQNIGYQLSKNGWQNHEGGDHRLSFAGITTSACIDTGTTESLNYCTIDIMANIQRDLIKILNKRIMSMEKADMFFKSQFTKNYFPDFIAKHGNDFIDVRAIILKGEQENAYHSVFQMVHDVKRIIYYSKEFLKTSVYLSTSTRVQQRDLNSPNSQQKATENGSQTNNH